MPGTKFKSGTLVKILVREKRVTSDGFATLGSYGGRYNHDVGVVYEEIRLSTFPSCNDFFGEKSVVCHGQLATVLSYVGRPEQIRPGLSQEIYDVYEVLIDGAVRQIFCQNISLGMS